MAEPMLRAFIEEWSPPGDRDPAPGRFVGEAQWPSPRIERRALHLNGDGLGDAPQAGARGDDPLALLDRPRRRRMDGHGRRGRGAGRPAP